MSVDSSRSPRPPFELRNATLNLIALVLGSTDIELISAALEARFGPTPALFDHDPVVIDLSALDETAEAIDFEALMRSLRARRLVPAGVEGGSAAQHAAALAAGLGETATYAGAAAAAATSGTSATASTSATAATSSTAATAAAAAAMAPSSEASIAADGGASVTRSTVPTLVIDRPLRSGQQVYARGGDLVVMAAVNFGAEVIADGHIHVYAPLRGRAVAGAHGNAAARIFSTCMEPQLVAIAGTYRTTETALPAEVLGKPAQVRLVGATLVFEALAA